MERDRYTIQKEYGQERINHYVERFREGLLSELRGYKQWVTFRTEYDQKGKPTKPPRTPRTQRYADPSDPSTWDTLREAVNALRSGEMQGIGFVFTDIDPFTALDLDLCVGNNRSVNYTEQQYVNYFNSYTEISPSGHGLHILIKGKLPGQNRKIDNLDIFSRGHYMTLTLNHLSHTPSSIEPRQELLDSILGGSKPKEDIIYQPLPKTNLDLPKTNLDVDDVKESVYYEYLTNPLLQRLMDGHWQGRYPSQSEADMALVGILLTLTNNNAEVTRELFMESKLVRSKTFRKWGDSTYLDKMISQELSHMKQQK